MSLEEKICDAMLDFLLAMPEADQDWNPCDPPVEVTSWNEALFHPPTSTMFGSYHPAVTIHYTTRSGDEDTYWLYDMRVGEFITSLCKKAG